MALNDLDKLYLTMRNEAPRIEMPEELRIAALAPLQKMLKFSSSSGVEK
jgi:quinolinate synthase